MNRSSRTPPHGAVLDYVLPQAAARVTLTVADARGNVVRRFASDSAPPLVDLDALDIPAWWIAPPVRLAASAGAHRFLWNLQATAPRTFGPGPTIAAIPHDTPLGPEGPTVPPGTYAVTLDAGGMKQTRALVVAQDPRVEVATSALRAQYAFATAIAARMELAYDASERVRPRDADLARKLARSNGQLAQLLGSVENGDGAPTGTQRGVFRVLSAALDALLGQAAPAPKKSP